MSDDKRERRKRRDHGLPWRFLVQDGQDASSIISAGDPRPLPFDELVVGDWLHIERMNDHDWHIVIGEVHLNARVTIKGVSLLVVEGKIR